jgi:hypothetical protein
MSEIFGNFLRNAGQWKQQDLWKSFRPAVVQLTFIEN